jgi:uncharacterized protein (DUF924 family)
MSDIDRVLAFWIEPKPDTEEAMQAKFRFWFSGGDQIDRDIHDKFGPLVERARAGELDDWAATPRGALALIILIDQFSRNLYRGRPESFSADGKALELARAGFDSGKFSDFDAIDLMFASLPFCHAEDLESQKRSVALSQRAALKAPPATKKLMVGGVEFARKHLDVIARFGRFPHRNAQLGRSATPEEAEYLEFSKFAGQWL